MENCVIKLEKFEGPLDLLLELIEKNKLDISDISLAKVTDQFISHLGMAQEKDPRRIADFLSVAAKLILIKSKTLLPYFSVTQEEERELTELKENLEQYRRIREGAKAIGDMEKMFRTAYHRHSELKNIRIFAPPENIRVDTLWHCFRDIRKTQIKKEKLEEKSVDLIFFFEEKIQDIKRRLERDLKDCFHNLADKSSKTHLIISFLAVLELIKQKFLTAEQEQIFGEIKLVKYTIEAQYGKS